MGAWQSKPNVGASLLAKTAYQSTSMLLIHRFREQARSHILISAAPASASLSSIILFSLYQHA
jgi:hypothetical protein